MRVTERALRLPVVEVGPASPVVAKAAGRGKRWGLIADVLGRAQAAAPALPEHARTTPPKLLPAGTDEEK